MPTCEKCGKPFEKILDLWKHMESCKGRESQKPPIPTAPQKSPERQDQRHPPQRVRTPEPPPRKQAEEGPPAKEPEKKPAGEKPRPAVPSRKKRVSVRRLQIRRGSKSSGKGGRIQQRKKSEKQAPPQTAKAVQPQPKQSKPAGPPEGTPQKEEPRKGKQQNTHILWSFSNVVLFTGSASYIDETDASRLSSSLIKQRLYMSKEYILGGWNCQDFMTLIQANLPQTLPSKGDDWKFILNTASPPFKEGQRTFKLYGSRKVYPGGGQDCGAFVCSSSWYGSAKSHYKLPDQTVVANTSSYMLRADLRKWVDSIDVGFPVFSVSDCNTFHTSGYVWGYYALKKAVRLHPLKLAVINFDQHWDTGGSGNVIGSDHWGNGVLKELHDLGFGGLYVVVGYGSKGQVGHVSAWDKEKTSDWGSLAEGNVNWEKCWKQYGNDVNAVFVTVDRDCLKNHCTQWQDNSYFSGWDQLRDVMSRALEPLFNRKLKAHLIGVDITGLPENHEIWGSRYPKRGKPDSSSVWAAVDSQINGLRSELADKLKATAAL